MKIKKSGVLAFALIILLFSMHLVLIYTNPFNGAFDKDWELVDATSSKSVKVDLPNNFGRLENITIQKRLPANLASDYLYFFTADQTVCVFVDDELIYEYGTKQSKKAFMKGPVETWHEVRMERDYEGKTLKVFFTYPYEWHSGQVFKMYLSSPRAFLRNLSRKYWFGLVFSYFSLTIFILIITFASVVKKRFGDLGSIMFIAAYALIASIWYLVDNKIFVFIVP